MSKTLRAARIYGWGEVPVVEDVPAPVAGEGEALVRVEVAAMSPVGATSDRLAPGTGLGLRAGRERGCAIVRPS